MIPLKKQLEEQAAISERLQARVRELESLVDVLRENVADEQRMYDALRDKRDEVESERDEALARVEVLEEELEDSRANLVDAETSIVDTWQKRVLRLAATCSRALPPETFDESWEVSRARAEIRDALDACRTYREVVSKYGNDTRQTVTRNVDAFTWSSAPSLLFGGL
jgi:chromosome segregation ATPase